MPRTTSLLLAAVIICLLTASSRGDVIISEIMYNPASSEASPVDVEWIEIYNTGLAPVDLTGWAVQDEDGTSSAFGAVSIAAGEAIVIIWDDQTIADFQAAWGVGFQIVPVENNLDGLSNSPSSTNEILQLVDSGSNLMDEVNYDDTGDWPSDVPDGPSIYLLPDFLDSSSNDSGLSWANSVDGVDGAYNNTITTDFNQTDTGSPGTVEAPIPAPAAIALFGIAVAGGRRRRRA